MDNLQILSQDEADSLYNKEQYSRAIGVYKQIDLDKPEMNMEAKLAIICKIADCHSRLGDYRAAIEIIKSATDFDKCIDTTIILGQNYLCLLEFDEARLVIETFLNSESYKLCEISNKETSEVLLNLMEMVKKKEKEYIRNKEEYPSFTRFEEFFKWIRLNRFSYFPKMELKFFSDCHRGVFAKKKINVKFNYVITER